MKAVAQVILILMATLLYNSASSQDVFNKNINIESVKTPKRIKDWLQYITEKYDVVFSYNANSVNDEKWINPRIKSGKLQIVLYAIFEGENLSLTFIAPNKIVLQVIPKLLKEITISGTVVDVVSGESIFGAIVLEKNSGTSVLTNEKGYYIMSVPKGELHLEVSYFTYQNNQLRYNAQEHAKIDFRLAINILLDTVVIQNEAINMINFIDGGYLMEGFKNNEHRSIIGEKDLITNARILPGVTSGGEGQSGLYVRGGTPDQNLILMEGVALYETSHVAGISSIFMDESIKEASFIRNGFPARYGGRLASVMDVQLKEGDKANHKCQFSLGLAGPKLHFNGPIVKNKTTYSLTARTSWLNFYVNNLLKKFTKYDDIIISYNDVLGKVTHQINETNSISFTYYQGGDRLRLNKNFGDEEEKLSVFDENSVSWRNRLASLRWTSLLTSKLSLKVQLGGLKYENGSRSTYIFETKTQDSIKKVELDVISKSNIVDYNTRFDLDYYLSDRNVFRGGFNFTNQNFNPTIKQSSIILKGEEENIVDKDSSLHAKMYQFYLEDNFKINTSLFVYFGLHYGLFKQGGQSYGSWQPRAKFIWNVFNKHLISASYSKMTQYIHLLTNPGIGLPSDLWVPSTDKIKPQDAHQFSLNYTYQLNDGFYFYAGAYTKSMSNSLEYTAPTELFYFLINNENITPVYNKSRDWERNVLSGKTQAKGVEFLVNKTKGKMKGWASITYSKTEKTFEDLNQGQPFPANHDKTWDVNLAYIQVLSPHFSFGLNFVYNTGNTFSLSTEEYNGLQGLTLLNTRERNNYRLPAFHQMSVNISYQKKWKLYETSLDLNFYNVYNRLNAYFIYIYEDNTAAQRTRILRKVSILPFTPSLTFSVRF